jgi:hypothetical protein
MTERCLIQLAAGNWCVSQSRALAAVRTQDRSRRPAPTTLAVGGVDAVGDRIVPRVRVCLFLSRSRCVQLISLSVSHLTLPSFNFLSSHPPSIVHSPFPSRCRLGREPCRLLSDPQPLVASAQNAKVKARNVTCKQADDVASCVTRCDEHASGAPGVSACSVGRSV